MSSSSAGAPPSVSSVVPGPEFGSRPAGPRSARNHAPPRPSCRRPRTAGSATAATPRRRRGRRRAGTESAHPRSASMMPGPPPVGAIGDRHALAVPAALRRERRSWAPRSAGGAASPSKIGRRATFSSVPIVPAPRPGLRAAPGCGSAPSNRDGTSDRPTRRRRLVVAAREVFLHEPLEGAVHRHHLDQRLQARMGLSEVPRVVARAGGPGLTSVADAPRNGPSDSAARVPSAPTSSRSVYSSPAGRPGRRR